MGSVDARDKYFLSYVGDFDPFPAKGLRSELPALEAARASLSGVVSELADAAPQLRLCRPEEFPSLGANTRTARGESFRNSGQSSGHQKGFYVDDLNSLLAEARSSIVDVRSVLA